MVVEDSDLYWGGPEKLRCYGKASYVLYVARGKKGQGSTDCLHAKTSPVFSWHQKQSWQEDLYEVLLASFASIPPRTSAPPVPFSQGLKVITLDIVLFTPIFWGRWMYLHLHEDLLKMLLFQEK